MGLLNLAAGGRRHLNGHCTLPSRPPRLKFPFGGKHLRPRTGSAFPLCGPPNARLPAPAWSSIIHGVSPDGTLTPFRVSRMQRSSPSPRLKLRSAGRTPVTSLRQRYSTESSPAHVFNWILLTPPKLLVVPSQLTVTA